MASIGDDGSRGRRPGKAAAARPQRLLDRVPAPLLFVAAAVSMYVGAALAVRLFEVVPAPGVAWLRLVGASAVLLAWKRPWRLQRTRRQWLLVGAFGSALAAMNVSYYLAVARLPLGTATAIEFLGPVAVAAAGTRSRRQVVALVMAVGGVALLADVRWQGSPSGVAFGLLAAALWAVYILLGKKVAEEGAGIDSLAAGTAIGTLVIAPIGLPSAAPAFGSLPLLLVASGIGLLSNVVPYALDQVVMRKVTAATFALLLSLLPATAAVVGFVVLGQVPVGAEMAGILLVVAGVATRGRTTR